jgi:hypothetical protein
VRDAPHNPARMRLTRGVFGFPKRLITQLRYAAYEGLVLTSTAGSVNKYFFSTNSIFDPDRTSTGHQPLYRDTYAAIYNQYAVVKSTIKVRFMNYNTALYWNAGLVIEDDNAGSSVLDTIGEQNTSMGTLLGPISSSKSTADMTYTWQCERDLNIDPYTSELYKTPVASNPNEEQFFCIWGNDAGSGTSLLAFQAEITYDVLFSELTTPTQS